MSVPESQLPHSAEQVEHPAVGSERPLNLDAMKIELLEWNPDNVPAGAWFIAQQGGRVVNVVSYSDSGEKNQQGAVVYNSHVRLYGPVPPTTREELDTYEEAHDNQCPFWTGTGYFKVWLLKTPEIAVQVANEQTQAAEATAPPQADSSPQSAITGEASSPPPSTPPIAPPSAHGEDGSPPVADAPTATPIAPEGAAPARPADGPPITPPGVTPPPQVTATEAPSPEAGPADTGQVLDAPPIVPSAPSPEQEVPQVPPDLTGEVVTKCPDHPRYRGKTQPRNVDCQVCWQLHRNVDAEAWEKNYTKHFGKLPEEDSPQPETSAPPAPAPSQAESPLPGQQELPLEAVAGFSVPLQTVDGQTVVVNVLTVFQAAGQIIAGLHDRLAALEGNGN